jgi:hypothetical protein
MRRQRESGFALLLVFAMAAAIAIMLYSQLPRAAFEAQREKEQLLIDRGQEYQRAIQLFVARWTKYPQSMDELEQFGGKRYLRRRYKDPMTGKDEWRLIRINAAGQLVDSAVKKTEEKKRETVSTFITEAPAMSGVNTTQTAAPNVGLRRRPSEQAPATEGADILNMPVNPGDNSLQLGQSANPQAATPVLPNTVNPQFANQNVPGMPAYDPTNVNNPGNIPGIPGQGVQPFPGGATAMAPANPNYPNPGGMGTGAAVIGVNPATAAIQAQLGMAPPTSYPTPNYEQQMAALQQQQMAALHYSSNRWLPSSNRCL